MDGRDIADTPLARWLAERTRGRTLGQLARDSGIGKSLWSTYLRGTAVPSPRTRRRLALYLGVSVAEIVALLPVDERSAGDETPEATRGLIAATVRETLAQLGLTPDDQAELRRHPG